MRFKSLKLLFVLIATAGSMGCSGISSQARDQVTFTGSFTQLQANADQYIGETVIWGGKVIQITPQNDGMTELIVLQLPLSSSDRPQSADQSQGRFIIHAAQFLDPALFPPGTLITAVGRMEKSLERPIGQMPYRYPVLSLVEIKKWPEPDTTGPRFHIGIGVGKTF